MLWFWLAMACFSETRNCSDGGLRYVFPEVDDVVPLTQRLAVAVGYDNPWTVCGLDGWDSATYALSGDISGELASGTTDVAWPNDLFWVELPVAPVHEELLTLRFNGDTGEGAWTGEVDTGFAWTAEVPDTVSVEAPRVTSEVHGGRTYVSLFGSGSADVDLTGLLVQTVSTQVLYGPDDVATSGEQVLSSTDAPGTDFVWSTGYVGVEDGATELCVWVRGIDVDQVEQFATAPECYAF